MAELDDGLFMHFRMAWLPLLHNMVMAHRALAAKGCEHEGLTWTAKFKYSKP
jgi:hypothetical protein